MTDPVSSKARHNKNQIVAIALAAMFTTAGGVLGAVTASHQDTDEIRPVAIADASFAPTPVTFSQTQKPAVAPLQKVEVTRAQFAKAEPAAAEQTATIPVAQPISFTTTDVSPVQAAPSNIPSFAVGQELAPATTTPSGIGPSVDMAQLIAEHHCLSETLYYEARGEPMDGKLAVAEVVFHRMRKASYPHSICGIVNQGAPAKCQFSFACKDADTRDHEKHARDWKNAQALAAKILAGTMPLGDLTGDATHFHAASASFEWPGLIRTIQIGNNIFYRDPPRSRAS